MKPHEFPKRDINDWLEILYAVRDGEEYTRGELVKKTGIEGYMVGLAMKYLVRQGFVDGEEKLGAYTQHIKGNLVTRTSPKLLHIRINEKGMETIKKSEALPSVVRVHESG